MVACLLARCPPGYERSEDTYPNGDETYAKLQGITAAGSGTNKKKVDFDSNLFKEDDHSTGQLSAAQVKCSICPRGTFGDGDSQRCVECSHATPHGSSTTHSSGSTSAKDCQCSPGERRVLIVS